MAMTTCDECGNDISTTAKTCPQCGARKARRKTSDRTILIAGSTILLVVFAWAMLDNQSTSRSSSGSSSALADARAVCDAIHATDFVTRCTVRTEQRVINLVINTSPSEARKICAGVREEVRPYTNRLGGWVFRIYSPLDTSSHIASCNL
jgi:hypothetical protein